MKLKGIVIFSLVVLGCASSKNIFDAAYSGNIREIEACITEGTVINQENKNGDTPLMYAIITGEAKAVDYLLEKGADPNIRNNSGDTPLIVSARRGYTSISNSLISHGANVDEQDKYGNTPLMLAIKQRSLKEVEELLSNGASINIANFQGQTPLIIAVTARDSRIAELLISRGAKIDAKAKNDFAALHDAISKNYDELAMFLIDSGADVNLVEARSISPLMLAILNSDEEMAEFLIEKGASVNYTDPLGYTPILYAINLRLTVLVAKLAMNGADVNVEIALRYNRFLDRAVKSKLNYKSKKISKHAFKPLDMIHDLGWEELENLLASKGATHSNQYMNLHGRKFEFQEKEYTPFLVKGDASICGQAFCKTKGGDVKYGAGNVVTLVPKTAYSLEILQRELFGEEDLIPEINKNFNKYKRTTVADGEGRFKFNNLPAGDYYVYCDIHWLAGSKKTGALAGAHIHLNGGEDKEIVVTPDCFDY